MDNKNQGVNNAEVEETNTKQQNILGGDFILLILILLIFFGNTDVFSGHFEFLNGQVKQIKNYLDMTDATIQALNQASQIPQQMLK